jgi:hypothetical protein
MKSQKNSAVSKSTVSFKLNIMTIEPIISSGILFNPLFAVNFTVNFYFAIKHEEQHRYLFLFINKGYFPFLKCCAILPTSIGGKELHFRR